MIRFSAECWTAFRKPAPPSRTAGSCWKKGHLAARLTARASSALLAGLLLLGAASAAEAQTPSCTAGSVAVTATNPADTAAASALAGDCAVLLDSMATLLGDSTATLNWAESLSMASWEGIELLDDRVVAIINLRNKFNGSFPDLSALDEVGSIRLRANALTGPAPGAAALPPDIKDLDLSSNRLDQTIPNLRARESLTFLDLGNNRLTGRLPVAAALPPGLTHLILQENELDGTIPDLHTLTSLTRLQLRDNALTGPIPAAAALPPNIELLDLQINELDQAIPDLHALTKLTDLILTDNALTGPFPAVAALPPNIVALHLDGNRLDQAIPDLSSLTALERLYATGNALSGNVPTAAMLPTGIQVVGLGGNKLTGSIPDLSARTSLTRLYLQLNELGQTIPALPTSLEVLHLAGNELTGAIPSQLGDLTALEHLSLCGNSLDASATLPAAPETRRTADPATLTLYSCRSIADASATEGDDLSFAVTLDTFPVRGSADAKDVSEAFFTTDGTATSADYTRPSGLLTIPGNTDATTTTSTANVTVATLQDEIVAGRDRRRRRDAHRRSVCGAKGLLGERRRIRTPRVPDRHEVDGDRHDRGRRHADESHGQLVRLGKRSDDGGRHADDHRHGQPGAVQQESGRPGRPGGDELHCRNRRLLAVGLAGGNHHRRRRDDDRVDHADSRERLGRRAGRDAPPGTRHDAVRLRTRLDASRRHRDHGRRPDHGDAVRAGRVG